MVGAVDAAIQGEDIVAGALGGAASGAITGAAADVIAVSGGSALVVAGAMAGASAIGAYAEHGVKSLVTGKDINWTEAHKHAAWSAAFGGLFGYMGGPVRSKLDKVAKKGLTKVLIDSMKGGAKKWLYKSTEELLSNVTAGVGRFIAEKGASTIYNNIVALSN